VKNKIRSNYIYLIFLIPIIPHFETSFRFLHTDDIPIVLYFIAFFIFENKKKVLIPFVKEIVPLVDIKNNFLKINPPNGLLEL